MEANSIGQHDGGDGPPHRGDPPSQEPEANKWGDADMKMIEAAMMVQIPSLFHSRGSHILKQSTGRTWSWPQGHFTT
jgi:hypothetical protein